MNRSKEQQRGKQMIIIERIKKVKALEEKLNNHPCCFNYYWDDLKRLTIEFPLGYYYGAAQGIRFNEETKTKALIKAIERLDEVWDINY